MMKANSFESDQKTLELIFPSKNSFNGFEALLEDFFAVETFTPPLELLPASAVFFDVGNQSGIKESFSIELAIVPRIKASDDAFQR